MGVMLVMFDFDIGIGFEDGNVICEYFEEMVFLLNLLLGILED